MPPTERLAWRGGCISKIEGYLSYLQEVGRKSPRTVIDVRCTLGRAIKGLGARRPEVFLWRLQLEDYLQWLGSERESGRASTSIAKDVSHIRGLLEYAWRSGRSERNVLDGFSVQHTLKRVVPKSLTLEEAEQLVRACPRGNRAERRERLVILLLYGCGLRTSELCALDVAHINRERQELQLLKTKGDRPRAVPIPAAVYTELLAYLLEHGKRGALLRTHFLERRIAPKDVCAIVTSAAERAHLRAGVTARTLRHAFATHLMDRGVDLVMTSSERASSGSRSSGV